MGRIVDKTGKRYGLLTVIERVPSVCGETVWVCQCDCGNKTLVRGGNLSSGAVKSCGCLRKERAAQTYTIHGEAKRNGERSKLYSVWIGMRRRCYDENSINYSDYGLRGITICDDWKDNFQKFKEWALSSGYDPALTIDRIENDKGYSPGNCRWTGTREQARNRRSNRIITFNGETHTAVEWEEKLGFSRGTISRRIKSRGWSIERALTESIHTENRGRWSK